MSVYGRSFLFLMSCFFIMPFPAFAAQDCTLILDARTTTILYEYGDCNSRHPAESTFKLPLALMGFDSGILQDAHKPVWDYKPEYNANLKMHRHKTDPEKWQKESVVWFSQKLTRKMGLKKFKYYVETLNYGNKDLSGEAGKNNGLTNAWLSSSLQISPIEQIAFLRGLLNRTFNISSYAYDQTIAIIPQFTAGEWNVSGKTGTGFNREADGTLNRDLQHGWFVGFANRADNKIIFAKFMADDKKEESYAGPRARDAFIKELPGIMAQDRHNEH